MPDAGIEDMAVPDAEPCVDDCDDDDFTIEDGDCDDENPDVFPGARQSPERSGIQSHMSATAAPTPLSAVVRRARHFSWGQSANALPHGSGRMLHPMPGGMGDKGSKTNEQKTEQHNYFRAFYKW